MSGVYIPGMEMPRNCHNCPLCLMRCCCARGSELTEKHTRPNAERPKDCPLIAVPDHGRLVDVDELRQVIQEYIEEYEELDENGLHNLKWCAMKEAEDVLLDAPTIIPASLEYEMTHYCCCPKSKEGET